MKQITDTVVEDYQAELWRSATERAESIYRVPQDEVQRIGELARGLYVLQTWQQRGSQGSAVRFLKEYSLSSGVIETLVADFVGKQELAEVKQAAAIKRADKWKSLETWAKNSLYQEVSTEKVVEVAGFSYQTVLNYIKTSGYFKQIKKGLWEVRDPKEDRLRDKLRENNGQEN